jgi:hypothetical protein
MAQFSVNRQQHLTQATRNDIHEVMMLSDRYGNIHSLGASATSAFGEPVSVPITPVIQLDSLYGFDPREFQLFSFGTGSNEATGTLFKCRTGTGAFGYGVIRSNRILRYRPGQGAMCRFTAAYENPQENVTIRAGFFAQEQALNIGYDGTKFGVLRQNGGKAHIHTFTVTTGGTGTVNITLNDVTTNVSIASADTTEVAKTIAGESFAGWTVEQCDNKLFFLSNSVGPLSGAFTYGGTGTATSEVAQTGIAHTNNWTYQENFNLDKLDGKGPSRVLIDPSKLNIFQISFRWLGAGEIRYAIEDPQTGDIIFFHHEHYSNRNTDVHLDNPSFRLGYIAANLSDSTLPLDSHVTGASMMAAIEGVTIDTAYTSAAGTSKTSLANNTSHDLITLKNAIIHRDKINLKNVKLKTLDIAAQGNDPIQIYLVLNATKSVTNTYNLVAEYSSVLKDVSPGTYTLANEHVASQFVIAANGASQIDLDKLEVVIPPGSTISIICSSSQSIQSIATSITWIEV